MSDRLFAVLERSRSLGFLGPGDVSAHLRHADAFASAWAAARSGPPGALLDLGTGGGVPGLALAERWRGSTTVLLDASVRRCAFLREAVVELGAEGRVSVVEGRAEELARLGSLEGRFDLVTARSFGPPAATAECAVRLLAPTGLLIVSEPPGHGPAPQRWPPDGLAMLCLQVSAVHPDGPATVVIERVGPCPDRYPRRNGVPAKRPLF